MPVIIPFVLAAAATVGAGIATVFAAIGGWGLLAKVALNFAISALVGKLGKSGKSGSGGYAAETRALQVIVRSAVASRNLIYGRAVTSGPLLFAHTTGTKNEYMHLVVAMAGHEIDGFEKIYFNDEEVGTLDAAGNVTTGRFAGFARIKLYTGTTTQTADADLVAESGGLWTANHRVQGVAYVYVRLKQSYDVFPSGLPNIKSLARGRRVYDPRDGLTRWTDNVALCTRDYLLHPLGLSALSGEIDDTFASASASICDERVALTQSGVACTFDATANTGTIPDTSLRFDNGDGVQFTTSGGLPAPLAIATTYYLMRQSPTLCKFATTAANARDNIAIDLTTAGTGTHQMVHLDQSRYTSNGILVSDRAPRDNIQSLLTSMAGAVIWVQGKYRIHAGAYSAPAFSLNENDLRSTITVQTRTPRKSLFNGIKGVYIEPWKSWQPTDFMPVLNSTYETQDGAQIFRDIDLPMVINQIRAQRIGKIHLEKSRQGITVQFPGKLRLLEISAWDTVQLSIAHLGWASKVFRVMSWQMTSDGGVDVNLQEDSSASYSWSMGDATVTDAAPDTTLPSLVTVLAPTGFVLDSGSDQSFVNTDGTVIVRVYAVWTAAADTFVTNYELQYKLSTEINYQSVALAASSVTAFISPAVEGATYNVRIRSINNYGVGSGWVSGSVVATGKNTPPGDPSALAAQSAAEAVKLTWVNPVDNDLEHIQIWESASNDRSLATQIATVSANFFTRTGLVATNVRYYWLRAVDTTGNLSGFHPVSAILGVQGTAGSVGVDYASVTGTKPPANADNTNSAVGAGTTVTSGGITFSAGGAIKGGQTDYNTGSGWFLGYSGGQYKFSIGDPVGSRLIWDGASLSLSGDVINIKQLALGDLIHVSSADFANVSTVWGTITTAWMKTKEFQVGRGGSLRIKFKATSINATVTYYAIYKNGVSTGAAWSTSSAGAVVLATRDHAGVVSGDLFALMVSTGSGTADANLHYFSAFCSETQGSYVIS